MQIQINTDNHISGGDSLTGLVQNAVMDAVDQFTDRITRVEVHLSDRNSSEKSGSNDKRCVMEARMGGMQPITVSDDGESIEQAVDGAAGKLQKVLSRTHERLGNRKGRTSYSGDNMTIPD